MTSENIWSRVRRRPFKPFRLNTSDGKHFDIVHPEMIYMTKNTVIVPIYDKGDQPGESLPARDVYISPLHVTSLEDSPPNRRQKARTR